MLDVASTHTLIEARAVATVITKLVGLTKLVFPVITIVTVVKHRGHSINTSHSKTEQSAVTRHRFRHVHHERDTSWKIK
jgi:hypothetical protein